MAELDVQEGRIARRDLLDAAATFVGGGSAPDGPIPEIAASIVAEPRQHLVVTTAATGSVRRAEVWMSSVGVVALAHQDDDTVPGPLILLPPYDAVAVCASAIGLPVTPRRAPGPRPVPEGMSVLFADVLAGAEGDSILTALDWDGAGGSARWTVLDGPEGRVAALHTDPTVLEPTSPMVVVRAVTARVVAATRPTEPTGRGEG